MTRQRIRLARSVRVLFSSLCIMSFTACSGGDSTSPQQQSAAVSILEFATTPNQFMVKGATQQLSVTARDGDGHALSGRQITWSSTDDAVATVSASGLVTALGTGLTSISATSEGRSTSFPLRVEESVGDVAVEYDEDILESGATYQLRARVRDSKGTIISSPTLAWSSSNTTVATVSGSGLLTVAGTHNDSVVVTAVIGGKTGRYRFFSWPRLADGIPVTIAGIADKSRWFTIKLPSGVKRLTVATTGGAGDADLYVWSPGTWAGATQMCESVSESTAEVCTIEQPQPGLWSIEIFAYTEFSNVQIRYVANSGS